MTTPQYWAQTGLNALAKGALSQAQGGKFADGVVGSVIGSFAASGAGIIGDMTQGNTLANMISHAVLGCAVAAAGKQDCASGALGGASSALIARAIDGTLPSAEIKNSEGKVLAEGMAKGTRDAIIAAGSITGASLLTGALGGDRLTAGNAAANEVTNNYLAHRQVSELANKLKACGQDKSCQQNNVSDALALSEKQSGMTRMELDAYYKKVDTWATQAINDCTTDICRQQVGSWSAYTKLQSSGSSEMTAQNLQGLQILVRQSNAGVVFKDIVLPIGEAALNFLPVAGMVGKVGGVGKGAGAEIIVTGTPKFSGSGPAPGVVAITDETSVAVLKNYKPSGREGIEFVFDPTTNTFAVGKPKVGLFDGSPHQQLARSIGADESKVVGGTFSRKSDGSIVTTENSGHYGQNWTPEIWSKFETWLSNRLGVPVNHQPWGKQ